MVFGKDEIIKLWEVADKLGEQEMLLQLAEECAELSQAALKLRRAMEGLTPVSVEQAREQLIEEMTDVEVCKTALEYLTLNPVHNSDLGNQKINRWYDRTFGRGDQGATD